MNHTPKTTTHEFALRNLYALQQFIGFCGRSVARLWIERPSPNVMKISLKAFFGIAMIATLLTLGVSGNILAQSSLDASRTYLRTKLTLSTVVFGDSNTQDFGPGIRNWYETLQSQIIAAPIQFNFTFNNQSVGGKSVALTWLDGQDAQYDINAALNKIGYTNIGFVMLGTNDAYRGVTVSAYIASYRALISAVYASGKVGTLVIMSVPPMIPPYNCLTGCFAFPTNPQVDRVVPYNQQLATIATYCGAIHYRCNFINSSAQIPLNATYIDPGTGIHLLNPAQAIIANNVYNLLKGIPAKSPGLPPLAGK